MILICHTSHEGHTAHLAQRAADACKATGFEPQIGDLRKQTPTLDTTQGVLVLASIHMGKHDQKLTSWVQDNKAKLQSLPGALVSVSLSADSGDPKREQEAEDYLRKFLDHTGWQSDQSLSVRGGIHLKNMGLIPRLFFKRLMRDQGLAADEQGDADFTDYSEFDRVLERFLAGVPTGRG
jgi:menaquinone-dependent protoporphyrinogen oxidase